MDSIFGDFQQLIQGSPWVAPAAAFIGGLLTASNPCVLISIPLIMSYIAGSEQTINWKRSLLYSLCMVLGLSVTFTILGLLSGLLGRFFGVQSRWWPLLIALVCIVMGMHLLGWIRFNFSVPLSIAPSMGGAIGAVVLGLLFGLVSTPCAVPILAVLLTFIAAKGNVFYGGMLLLAYSMGHCILVLLGGISAGIVKNMVSSKGWTSANLWMRRSAGVLIMLVGFYILFTTFLRGIS